MLRTEPVIVAALARVGVVLGTAFGLALTAEQVVTLITVAEVIIAWWTRRRVTPVRP